MVKALHFFCLSLRISCSEQQIPRHMPIRACVESLPNPLARFNGRVVDPTQADLTGETAHFLKPEHTGEYLKRAVLPRDPLGRSASVRVLFQEAVPTRPGTFCCSFRADSMNFDCVIFLSLLQPVHLLRPTPDSCYAPLQGPPGGLRPPPANSGPDRIVSPDKAETPVRRTSKLPRFLA
jgi:hypothetical protein